MKVGQTYRIYYNEGNRNNKVIEIRAVVDDVWVVYRHRRRDALPSDYYLEHRSFFNLLMENCQMHLEEMPP